MPKNELFGGGSWHGTVKLNFLGDPLDEFAAYADGFHQAGQVLAANMAASHGYMDTDALPIVFLYRHAFELYMKALIIGGSRYKVLRGDAPIDLEPVLREHRLPKLLPPVLDVFAALSWTWALEDSIAPDEPALRELLREIDQLDRGSYTFRYPVKKDGAGSLPEHFNFNVLEFCERLDPILESLDGACTGVDEAINTQVEINRETQP